MAITAAVKVLIADGVLNLASGALLGYPITVIRAKGAPAPRGTSWPRTSARCRRPRCCSAWRRRPGCPHWGQGWNDVAAWLVVAASALMAAKDTVNWLTGVNDEFGEKSKATLLGGLGALPETIGVGIFVAGVLKALRRPLPGAWAASRASA